MALWHYGRFYANALAADLAYGIGSGHDLGGFELAHHNYGPGAWGSDRATTRL
jgi:hypothetical protein